MSDCSKLYVQYEVAVNPPFDSLPQSHNVQHLSPNKSTFYL
jgi:hypothetical protein